MTIHIATVDGQMKTRSRDGLPDRAAIVKRMAEHLVAGILHDKLDTSSERDIIETLYNAEDRFHYRVILDHFDDAKAEALQMMVAMEMSKQETPL
jgi:hypothetical protein